MKTTDVTPTAADWSNSVSPLNVCTKHAPDDLLNALANSDNPEQVDIVLCPSGDWWRVYPSDVWESFNAFGHGIECTVCCENRR